MSAELFLDTNVLIYHLDDSDPHKHAVADRIVRAGLQSGNACISFQVVQECLNAGLRKAAVPLDSVTAEAYLATVLAPLWRVMPSEPLYRRCIHLHDRYRFSFYDSLIIAAALEARCARLYSEDLQDGQVIDGLRIENPF